MIKGPDKNNFSFENDNSLPGKKVKVDPACAKELFKDLGVEETSMFAHIPEEYIEKIALDDVEIFFNQAQKLFSQHHYAQAIAKIDSLLLWKDKWLSNNQGIKALFLKAQCLSELTCYMDCSTLLSYIDTNYHDSFTPKWLLQYKFLAGVTSLHLEDYRKAHRCFEYIIDMKHTMNRNQFEKIFAPTHYVQVLLEDTDCLINNIWLADGQSWYNRVNSYLKEAAEILSQYPGINNKENYEKHLHELQEGLRKHIEGQG